MLIQGGVLEKEQDDACRDDDADDLTGYLDSSAT